MLISCHDYNFYHCQDGSREHPPHRSRKARAAVTPEYSGAVEPRIFRRSTQEVSEEHRKRQQEEERRRKRHFPRAQKMQRKMTQKEMLEEAKWTELENLASLEAFTRLEEEKKRVKEKKQVAQGPVIRFHSVTMPLIAEAQESGSSDSANTSAPTGNSESPQPNMYCRNFLIFTDTRKFPSTYFPNKKPPKPTRLTCPITGLPAKYIDPVTETPYSTPQAFKIIRNRYISAEEEKCERRLLQLSSWLAEKKRKKQESRI